MEKLLLNGMKKYNKHIETLFFNDCYGKMKAMRALKKQMPTKTVEGTFNISSDEFRLKIHAREDACFPQYFLHSFQLITKSMILFHFRNVFTILVLYSHFIV
jgi:hypothetical protein